MASRKVKHAAALAKRESFLAEEKARNLANLGKEKEAREARAKEAKRKAGARLLAKHQEQKEAEARKAALRTGEALRAVAGKAKADAK